MFVQRHLPCASNGAVVGAGGYSSLVFYALNISQAALEAIWTLIGLARGSPRQARPKGEP